MPFPETVVSLLDDLDNPVGTRVDQHRAVVHDGVTIIADAIFGWDVIIGDAFVGQHRADAHVIGITVGRDVPLDDIAVKAWPLIDAENPGNAAHHTSDDAADNGSDRTGGAFAISRTPFNSTRNPLRLRNGRKGYGGSKSSNSDKAADHDISQHPLNWGYK